MLMKKMLLVSAWSGIRQVDTVSWRLELEVKAECCAMKKKNLKNMTQR